MMNDEELAIKMLSKYKSLVREEPKKPLPDVEWMLELLKVVRKNDIDESLFTEERPEHGDIIEINSFIAACKHGNLIDYDGHGSAMRNGKVCKTIMILPSKFDLIPNGTTHILWYNR